MLRKLLLPFLFIAFFASQAFAQTGSITGTVTNEDGEPVPTANVLLVEVSRGAATNLQGEYTIENVEPGTYTLRVTFVGYKDYTDQVTIEAGETLTENVILTQGTFNLNELIVTAFGIEENKRSVTYQTAVVEQEDIQASGAVSPVSSLVGKVAGLRISRTSSSGYAEPSLDIDLRGRRSITRSSNPLIVIDGVKASTGALEALNTLDIKSFNVLKGASAAAIYGSDAANGAIIVTTKTGSRNDEFTVGYKNSTIWKTVAFMPDYQTKFGSGIGGLYVPFENTNWGPRLDGQMRRIGPHFPDGYPVEDQLVRYIYRDNNLKELYGTARTLQNTLYFSGGGDNGSFYTSIGYANNTGLYPRNDYKRLTITANAKQAFKDITVSVHTSYSENNGHSSQASLYWLLMNTPVQIPLSRYKNWQDPTSYANPNNYYNRYYDNPYAALDQGRNIDKGHRFRGNVSAQWDIVDNISITGTVGTNAVWNDYKGYTAYFDYNTDIQITHSDYAASVTVQSSKGRTVHGNVIAQGNFQLTEDFGLDATVGTAVEMYRGRSMSITGNNLSIPGFYDPSNRTGEPGVGFDLTESRSYGVFGKIKFNYDRWVYLLLTGRKDFSSTLPLDDNAYFYPSAGITFILSDAIPALGNLDFLSFLKITANNSTVYNDLSPYQIAEVYAQTDGFPLGSVNAFIIQSTAISSSIQKEKLNSTEISLSAGFFNGRLNFDGSWFYNKTSNLITRVTPSVASGATGYLTNIGSLHNTGFGLSLKGSIIQTNNINFSIGANLTTWKQVVDEVQPGTDKVNLGNGLYAVLGKPFPLLRVRGYKRDPQGRVIVDPKTGIPIEGDLKAFGQTSPKYSVAVNPSFSYKNLRIAATMSYRTGFVFFDSGLSSMMFTGRNLRTAAANRQPFVFPNSSYDANPDPEVTNYVANTNIPVIEDPRIFFTHQYDAISENYVRDGTEFKLRLVSVSYALPAGLLSRIGAIKNLRIGLTARNLIILTPTDQTRYTDPEFGGGVGLPPTRSFGFNVNIEF